MCRRAELRGGHASTDDPVMISVAGVDTATALWSASGLAAACPLLAGLLRAEWAYGVGWSSRAPRSGLGSSSR